MSDGKSGFRKLCYTEGKGAKCPEYVSFEIDRIGEPAIIGGIRANTFMFNELKIIVDDTGAVYDINEAQISELSEFIRRNRERIKYERTNKTYEEWRTLGIPLEDYLPIWTQVNDSWLKRFERLQKNLQSWMESKFPFIGEQIPIPHLPLAIQIYCYYVA